MVKMTDDNVSPPYKIAPGTRVRLESAYDGNTRRLGVMVHTLAWPLLQTSCTCKQHAYCPHVVARGAAHTRCIGICGVSYPRSPCKPKQMVWL